ncbi:MAG: extracellular solute-binding protein [Firmicutes bacterium]|nr:extracellular solute-binding protein [Bacillota bacterium]
MKNFRLGLIILVILIMKSSAFSAPDKVTLRLAWWGNPTRDARTLKVVELYMAKNPNVTIETETTSWAGYWDKLATQAAANNLPDIIQQDYAYITQYAQKDLLLDLGPAVRAKKINLANVPDTFISGGKVNNKLYGISLGTNAFCLYYDPAVLQKAGVPAPAPNWTWRDFEKMAVEIYSRTGVQTLPLSATDPKVAFENMIRQTGKPFFNKYGTGLGFTDPQLLIEFYDLQLRLLKANALIKPDLAFVATTPQESPFAKGLSWVQFCWSNQVVSEQAAANRPIAISLLPRIANPKRPGTFLKPSMFFSVSKASANKDEAVKFINYFINDLEANQILLAERGIPIIPKIRDALMDIMPPVNRQIFEFINLAGNNNASPIDPADPPGASEVLKIFRTIDQEVLYGATSAKEAAAKFMAQANEILGKNKAAK